MNVMHFIDIAFNRKSLIDYVLSNYFILLASFALPETSKLIFLFSKFDSFQIFFQKLLFCKSCYSFVAYKLYKNKRIIRINASIFAWKTLFFINSEKLLYFPKYSIFVLFHSNLIFERSFRSRSKI